MCRKIRCDGNLVKFWVFGASKQGLTRWQLHPEMMRVQIWKTLNTSVFNLRVRRVSFPKRRVHVLV